MFIEVTVAADGTILRGWCADTAPVDVSRPLYTPDVPDPVGSTRVRLDLSLVDMLEIEDRAKAVAGAIATAELAAGHFNAAAQALADWKRYRLEIIGRDLVVDLKGPARQAPAGVQAQGITYRGATLRARPEAPVVGV